MTAVETPPLDEPVVNAEPTKDFFISMLTRDIDLKDAVIDLVDNCVDGARRLRTDQRFDGLHVNLRISADSFEIEDNCGGMSIETAEKYAFRFGREGTPVVASPRTIGQFGVGMKRTLFKLGTHFRVSSQTTTESFVIDVPVLVWRKEPSWNFKFETIAKGGGRRGVEPGTTITVTGIYPDASESLADEEWLEELTDDIRLKHGMSIRNGLSMQLNGDPIEVEELALLVSQGLHPGVLRDTYPFRDDGVGSASEVQDVDSDSAIEDEVKDQPAAEQRDEVDRSVYVTLIAGVGLRASDDAGWYVFCNGRLVLGPDRSRATTWSVKEPARVPLYHDQFSRFRGYALFESDDPSRLPWTTTKTGVDADNGIWRSTRASMISMTRPVIDFLNLLDRQNTAAGGWEAAAGIAPPPDGHQPTEVETEYAERVLHNADSIPVSDLRHEAAEFAVPEIDSSNFKDSDVRISYVRTAVEVRSVRERLGTLEDGKVPTNGQIGEETFDYYWRNEIEQ